MSLVGIADEIETESGQVKEPVSELEVGKMASVVVISGDAASGSGFVVKHEGGLYVVTNQHVLAGQKKMTIENSGGESLRGSEFVAAVDRDIALMKIEEAPERSDPFEITGAMAKEVKSGDQVLVPGNSAAGGVITMTPGKVLAIGPVKIEVDAPVFEGNSGGPIIHVESGKVIGVLTEATLLKINTITKASMSNRNSQIKEQIRYFGHRIDNVEKWEKLDWKVFQSTTRTIERASSEVTAMMDYMTGRGETWKSYEELHEAHNELMKALRNRKLSVKSKQSSRQRFVRQLSMLSKSPMARLKGKKTYFIHRSQIELVDLYEENLMVAIDILQKDISLLNRLGR